MPKSSKKLACDTCTSPMDPVIQSPSVPPIQLPMPPVSDSPMDIIMFKLDDIASKLENSGMVRLAEEVDQISNSIGKIKKS